MAHIGKADYETVTVTCDACRQTVVLNRMTDIGYAGPYSGDDVQCPECNANFRISFDSINTAYEMFVFDADEHFANKRYMLVVATLGQAWEIFLSTFADSLFLWRPFFACHPYDRDVDLLNDTQKALHRRLRNFSFFELQNLVVRTVVDDIHPATLVDAAGVIPKLGGFGRDVSRKRVAAVGDEVTRTLLSDLRSVTVGSLRNRVVHQRAYRPTRTEAHACLQGEIVLLYRLRRHFGVGTFEEYSAGIVRHDWPASGLDNPLQGNNVLTGNS